MPGSSRRELVLFVCTANRARSPLARLICEDRLRAHDRRGVIVRSAGTHVEAAHSAIEEVARAAEQIGLKAPPDVVRALDAEMIRRATLIIAMTEAQRARIVRLAPASVGRTFTLIEINRLLAAHPADTEHLAQFAKVMNRARAITPAPSAPEDIPDPAGRPLRQYQRLATLLSELIEPLVAHISSVAPGPERASSAT